MESDKVKDFLKEHWAGVGVAVATGVFIIFKLTVAFSTESISYESYYALSQIKHIAKTGIPLTKSLRTRYFSPVYYYILAGLSLLKNPVFILKTVPSVFLSAVIPLTYLLSLKITKSRVISFATALFASFAPSIIGGFVNSAEVETLLLPLFLLAVYLYTDFGNNFVSALVTTVFIILLSPMSFVLIGGLLLYSLLLRVEGARPEKNLLSTIIFSLFLGLWYYLIIYKTALLKHGLWVFWKNTPSQLLADYFANLTIASLIYALGFIPLILGITAAYHTLFEKKKKSCFLVFSFLLSSVLITWLKLLPLRTGVFFITSAVIVLASHGLKVVYSYLSKTRFSSYRGALTLVIAVLFVLTSVLPGMNRAYKSLEENSPSEEEVLAVEWIEEFSPENSTILATPKEGFFIEEAGEREVVMTENFLSQERPDKTFSEIEKMYTSRFKIEALSIAEKYNVDYFYLSRLAEEQYSVEKPEYLEEECFQKQLTGEVSIYSITCKVKKEKD